MCHHTTTIFTCGCSRRERRATRDSCSGRGCHLSDCSTAQMPSLHTCPDCIYNRWALRWGNKNVHKELPKLPHGHRNGPYVQPYGDSARDQPRSVGYGRYRGGTSLLGLRPSMGYISLGSDSHELQDRSMSPYVQPWGDSARDQQRRSGYRYRREASYGG